MSQIEVKKYFNFQAFNSSSKAVAQSSNSNDLEVREEPVEVPVSGTSSTIPLEENSSDDFQQRPAPVQEETVNKIGKLESQLNVLLQTRDALPTDVINKEVVKKQHELRGAKKTLKRLQDNAKHQKKHRAKLKTKLNKIAALGPECANILKMHDNPGRPSLDESQSGINELILELAMFGSGADERRRSECIRSVKTLDDLHGALLKQGFEISR